MKHASPNSQLNISSLQIVITHLPPYAEPIGNMVSMWDSHGYDVDFTRASHEYHMLTILCLTSRTTVTSARIPEEDACHRARNLCVFSHVQKGTPRLTHKGCVLQRVFLDALSDVTVVLGMRQSICKIHITITWVSMAIPSDFTCKKQIAIISCSMLSSKTGTIIMKNYFFMLLLCWRLWL